MSLIIYQIILGEGSDVINYLSNILGEGSDVIKYIRGGRKGVVILPLGHKIYCLKKSNFSNEKYGTEFYLLVNCTCRLFCYCLHSTKRFFLS